MYAVDGYGVFNCVIGGINDNTRQYLAVEEFKGWLLVAGRECELEAASYVACLSESSTSRNLTLRVELPDYTKLALWRCGTMCSILSAGRTEAASGGRESPAF